MLQESKLRLLLIAMVLVFAVYSTFRVLWESR
jgi:hypothetical protein